MNKKIISRLNVEELVINWHITEACNYDCGFCFAKWGKPNELHSSFENIETMLKLLSDYFIKGGCKLQNELGYSRVRLNFAGGEPFILGNKFNKALLLAKAYGFKTSLITNGHHLIHTELKLPSNTLDMIGVSFDSQYKYTQLKIGRANRKGEIITASDLSSLLYKLKSEQDGIKLKLNTVVNPYNWQEDFTKFVSGSLIDKWKVLRALPYQGHKMLVTDEQYDFFLKRHHDNGLPISVESNEDMTESYMMIDPAGRFYQNSAEGNGYKYSRPVLEVGVKQALASVSFDVTAFIARYQLNA